jgi:hypothetical protein
MKKKRIDPYLSGYISRIFACLERNSKNTICHHFFSSFHRPCFSRGVARVLPYKKEKAQQQHFVLLCYRLRRMLSNILRKGLLSTNPSTFISRYASTSGQQTVLVVLYEGSIII